MLMKLPRNQRESGFHRCSRSVALVMLLNPLIYPWAGLRCTALDASETDQMR